ncbi:MAG: hypothetical protein LBK03_06415 [Bacteroidales bacterium]|jgi:hypothetical protein|nr:hypothetical protein [Bacteroidales bacterium]
MAKNSTCRINLNNNSILAQIYTYYKNEYNTMQYIYNQRRRCLTPLELQARLLLLRKNCDGEIKQDTTHLHAYAGLPTRLCNRVAFQA